MCNSVKAFLSQYFGYQVENSGTVDAAAMIALDHTRPVYTPTNPLSFTAELGFNGYRYGLDARKIVGPHMAQYYNGIMPLSEQPRISAPMPYDVPLV